MNDPADYSYSGHREILGHREPLLIDIPAVLTGFDGRLGNGARERYLAWIRAVAEAKWFAQGVENLPWWKGARNADEIVGPDLHPEAKTFDGQALEDDRLAIDLGEFVRLFEQFSGHRIAHLSSPLRSPGLIRGRIELTTLAAGRYRLRSRDIAALIAKHPSSLTRWLKLGLLQERKDRTFRDRLDSLDRGISAAARNNASMRRVAP